MSHPVATHISTTQDHELNHWLKNHQFRETSDNRDLLCDLIGDAKTHNGKKSSEHLTHDELNDYFDNNSDDWSFEIAETEK